MLGEVVGSYRVTALLGEGGMGVVYRAEHVQLGKPVALKVVQPALSADPTMVERFFTEARAASSIDHAGIVEVHDFGTHTDGRAYLVMTLLRGENLEQRLERGPLPVIEATTILAQAAAALAAAHDRGIIHRDLKPDNIFLVPNEMMPSGTQVVLLDFGIAKLASDRGSAARTQVGALIGTPAYMSPEQCQGRADLDHRTDLYSLGCILFHALCGRPPFVSEQGTGVMVAAHVLDPPPRPTSIDPDIPPAVEAIVMRLLAKDPADRFRTANELRDALVRAGARAPLTKPPRDEPRDEPPDEFASTVAAPAAIAGADTVASIAPSARRAPTKPTTGGGSAGQVLPPPLAAKRKRRWVLVGGGAAVAMTAVSIALFTRGDDPPAAREPELSAERGPPVEQACPRGQVRSINAHDRCCWPDQMWSTTRGVCVGVPTCPRGMVVREERCVDERPELRELPSSTTWGTPSPPAEPLERDPAFTVATDPIATGSVITIRFAKPIHSMSSSRAWVSVSEAGASARQYLDWAFVEHGSRSARLRAPSKAGKYELRLYNNYPTQSHNLVRIAPIVVSPPAAPEPGETPIDKQRFDTDLVQKAGTDARLDFPVPLRPARGERFWVTVVPEDAFDSTWQVYRYVPIDARSFLMPLPAERGAYEIRLHSNYPTRTTNVVHRARIRIE